MTIDTLQVAGTNTLDLNNGTNLGFVSGASVSNNQNINVSGTGALTSINFNGNATITGSGTITLGNNLNNRINQSVGGGIITHTAGHIIRGAGNVLAGTGGMDNAGTIIADQANVLTIDPGTDPFNNTGTLRAQSGATLRLQSGTFNNAGGLIEADGPGSNVDLASPLTVINGGTLTTTNGGEIRSNANGGPLLNGITLTTGSNFVQGNGGDTRIQGNLLNNGTWELNAASQQTFIQFLGSQTISGTGEIVMGPSINNDLLVGAGADVLTQAAGHTIRGSGDILQGTGEFINNGAILQQGAVALTIDPGTVDVDGNGNNFVNNGTLRSEGTGGLTLNGANYLNAGQTIQSTGGGDIRLNSTSTTIRGGTFDITGGGVLRSTINGGALLDGVTISGNTSVVQGNSEDFRNQNGLTNNGTWNLNATSSQSFLQFLGTQTLTGTGEIVMGQSANNDILVGSNAQVLTQAATHTIRGAGDILQGTGGMINNGTILQQGAVALTLNPGTIDVDGNGNNFINNNVLRSEGTGGFTLEGGNFLNAGQTIESTGGGDIRLANTATVLRVGTVAISGGGVLRSTINGGALLDGVTISTGTNVVQANSEDFRIQGGLTNNGTWNLNAVNAQTFLQFLGSQTLTGSGEIVMGNSISNDILVSSNSTVLTQAAGHTIRGAGDILRGTGGMINQGDIIADQSLRLRIDAGANFSQQGLLRASGSGGIEIDGNAAFTQAAGLTDIQSGSQVTVTQGDYVQTGGETRVTGTLATLGFGSNVQLQGGWLTGTGLIDFNGIGVHVLNNTGGTLAAGASPGILTVQDGNYVQGAGGTFEFELDGFVAGVGHDLLSVVNGDADLGGDLNVIADLAFASTLNIGDQFEVVRLDPAGTFLDGNGDLTPDIFDTISVNLAGLVFSQLFIGNSLWIEVTLANVGAPEVPEPHMLVVMMLGLTVIVWMRRRRANVTIR